MRHATRQHADHRVDPRHVEHIVNCHARQDGRLGVHEQRPANACRPSYEHIRAGRQSLSSSQNYSQPKLSALLQNALDLVHYSLLWRSVASLTVASYPFRFHKWDALGQRIDYFWPGHTDLIGACLPPIAQGSQYLPPPFAAGQTMQDNRLRWRWELLTTQHIVQQETIVAESVQHRLLKIVETAQISKSISDF